ncbi:zf-HC2 domain-containing protein [Micromonospora mirobrigensis]|uniref:Putative zinc-finger n=1 Tax=Micromonospora mirobrigensis TaxID=262898 RepID=A0A1C4VJG0_9ACTN|nr:zf-HC2 domain-containing protein [Micromonospora mirobrigensis]SCE84096.1 Putative zinc-finger [Micromonospora mirobrigensis]
MSGWHVDEGLLADYDRGTLPPSRVLAVDTHLLACASCREQVRVDPVWLTGNWSVVFDALHEPRSGPLHRFLRRLGLPEHRIRLIAATPALRWSWLGATATVLALAVAAAYLGRGGMQVSNAVLLVVAPVLPVLAVATAYGPPADPMHEITDTTPAAGPALVLWRATTVVTVAVVMGVVAAVLLPGPGWYAVAWLLPALLLSVGTLALSTVIALPAAAGVLGGIWLAGVGTAVTIHRDSSLPLVFGRTAQLGYLFAAMTAVVVLTVRRRRLDPGETR